MTQHVKNSPMAPELELAKHFLQLLDPKATAFTFQTLDDNQDRKSTKLNKVLHGSLEKHWQTLTSLSTDGAGVFVTINETDLTGRKEANINRVRAVFVDTDGAPQEPIEKYSPHIVVETSPGRYHNYWLVNGCPLTEFKEAQTRMIEAWGTDKAINDLSRIMRLPGFPHQKVSEKKGLNGTPFLVKFVGSPKDEITPDDWATRLDVINSLAQMKTPENQSSKKQNLPARAVEEQWELGPTPPHATLGVKTNVLSKLIFDEASECLQLIDPRPRGDWVKVTTIIAAEFGEAGRELAHEWARGDLWNRTPKNDRHLSHEQCKYSASDTDERYDEALERDALRESNRAGIGSLYHMAQKASMHGNQTARPDNVSEEGPQTEPKEATAETFLELNTPNINLTSMSARTFSGPKIGKARLFPKDAISIFTALGGTGKTTALVALASHIAAGKKWDHEPIDARPVIYIAVEEVLAELNRKVGSTINNWEQEERKSVENNLRLVSLVGEDPRLTVRHRNELYPSPLVSQIISATQSFNAELVILDHLQGFVDGDLNNSDTATALSAVVNRIVASTGAAVTLAAHVNKSQIGAETVGAGFTTGSLAFENAARQVVGVIKLPPEEAKTIGQPSENGILKFVIAKNSYGPVGDHGYFERVYVPDFHTITIRAFLPPHPVMRTFASKSDALDAKILDYLQKHPYRTKRNLDDLAGKDGQFKASRQEIRVALQRLIDAETVKLEEIPNSDKQRLSIANNVKEGFVVIAD